MDSYHWSPFDDARMSEVDIRGLVAVSSCDIALYPAGNPNDSKATRRL